MLSVKRGIDLGSWALPYSTSKIKIKSIDLLHQFNSVRLLQQILLNSQNREPDKQIQRKNNRLFLRPQKTIALPLTQPRFIERDATYQKFEPRVVTIGS